MTCHWDGYCNNRNNYRLYFDPTTTARQFLPHGMDQMFGDTNANVLGTPGALVCQAVLTNPEWRAKYRDRLARDAADLFAPDKLHARVDAVHARLKPVLAAMNENLARDNENHARGLKDRLTARAKTLEQQIAVPEPRPLSFDAAGSRRVEGVVHEDPNRPTPASSRPRPIPSQVARHRLRTQWAMRCFVADEILLTAGTYQFSGRAKAEGLAAIQSASGIGAGLRISGGQRTNQIQGDADWQELTHEITIGSPLQELELVAELRASKGLVRFDPATLRIVKKPK